MQTFFAKNSSGCSAKHRPIQVQNLYQELLDQHRLCTPSDNADAFVLDHDESRSRSPIQPSKNYENVSEEKTENLTFDHSKKSPFTK